MLGYMPIDAFVFDMNGGPTSTKAFYKSLVA